MKSPGSRVGGKARVRDLIHRRGRSHGPPVVRGRSRPGRLLLHGAAVAAEQEVRRRIANVAARAAFTQPERRVVSVRVEGEDLEVLTTAQELAHRIVHELQKAFGGRAAYAWSDRDGSLRAVWEMPARAREAR